MDVLGRLTTEQRAAWERDGYLILRSHYSHAQVDALDAVTDWAWKEKPRSLTIDETTDALARKRFCEVRYGRPGNRVKLNDLYLLSETVRTTVLDHEIAATLAELLGDDPVLVNTLTIDNGTEQPPHVDTLYMTPLTDDALVATWIALEDVTIDSGPLFYYPGSHRLPPFRFNNGLQHLVDGEFASWWAAIETGMRERSIERQVFLAGKGDVFIWHARLVHGGSAILNPAAGRRSIVSHFFTKLDCLNQGIPMLRAGARGLWLNREEHWATNYGEPIALPDPDIVSSPLQRVATPIAAALDYVIPDGSSATLAVADEYTAAGGFTLRGWVVDNEKREPAYGVGVELPDGRILRGIYGLGRPDLVAAFESPNVNHCGYLAHVPSGTLPAGVHTLNLVALMEDATSRPTPVSLRVVVP